MKFKTDLIANKNILIRIYRNDLAAMFMYMVMPPIIFIWYDYDTWTFSCFDIYLIHDTFVWYNKFLKTEIHNVEYDKVSHFEKELS